MPDRAERWAETQGHKNMSYGEAADMTERVRELGEEAWQANRQQEAAAGIEEDGEDEGEGGGPPGERAANA